MIIVTTPLENNITLSKLKSFNYKNIAIFKSNATAINVLNNPDLNSADILKKYISKFLVIFIKK